MTDQSAAEPLYNVIRGLRRPACLRELMASCLRSIYMGDAFGGDKEVLPKTPRRLLVGVSATELSIAQTRCVIYLPKNVSGSLPLILYMHGGGFVIGCSEDTDYTCRVLCYSNKAIVVSVNYRLAPETMFPGALEDCERVLSGLLEQSDALGFDSSAIFTAGDSAGANLALALPSFLRQRDSACSGVVRGTILLAPWLDMQVEQYSSYNEFAPSGIVFDAPFLAYARAAYARYDEWTHPLVSPLFSGLPDLPPSIVFIGTVDPFLDQVLRLRKLAQEADCRQLEIVTYPGMPHCFYSLPNLFEEEKDCYKRIAEFVQRQLSGAASI